MYQYFIPFYGQIIFHCMDIPHFIHPFIRWWAFGLFLPFSYCAWHCDEQYCTSLYLFKHPFSILLGISLGVELSSARVILCFNFLKNHQTVFHSFCTVLHSHQQCMKAPFSPRPHQHLSSIFFFLITAILVGVKWYLVVLICIPLMTNRAEHLFICC